MPWLKIDDELDEHPKFTRYDEDFDVCVSTWLQLALYCARRLTDGVIPRRIESRHDPRIIALLLEPYEDGPGPCERNEDGLLIMHDYLDYNPSRAEWEAQHAQKVDAGKAGAAKRWGTPATPSEIAPAIAPAMAAPLARTRTRIPCTDESKSDSSVSARDAKPRGDVSVVGAEYERLTGQVAPSTPLVALCADHPTDRCIEAISRGVQSNKPRIQYIAAIARSLAAEGWTAPPVLTAVPDPFYGLCGEEQA